MLSFREGNTEYSPEEFPTSPLPLIAPFWEDVNTNVAGSIFYQLTSDSSMLQRAQNVIRGFNVARDFTPNILFVATWDHVAEFLGSAEVSYCTILYLSYTALLT